jgi:hypothetical protein
MPEINLMEMVFEAKMRPAESKFLRGAVIAKLQGKTSSNLHHNHLDNKGSVCYDYPKVQYKTLDGKPMVVCIGEGVEVGEMLLSAYDGRLQLGNRSLEAPFSAFSATTFEPQYDAAGFRYRVMRWQPLNADNYAAWKKLIALTDKICLLEQIFAGHVLGLYQGLGIHIDQTVECSLTRLSDPYVDSYKGISTTLFDIEVILNHSLPIHCGIGKGASLGFGMIEEIRSKY